MEEFRQRYRLSVETLEALLTGIAFSNWNEGDVAQALAVLRPGSVGNGHGGEPPVSLARELVGLVMADPAEFTWYWLTTHPDGAQMPFAHERGWASVNLIAAPAGELEVAVRYLPDFAAALRGAPKQLWCFAEIDGRWYPAAESALGDAFRKVVRVRVGRAAVNARRILITAWFLAPEDYELARGYLEQGREDGLPSGPASRDSYNAGGAVYQR